MPVCISHSISPDMTTTRSAAESAGVGRAIIGGGWQNPSVPSFPPAPLPHPQGYMTYAHCDIECADCDIRTVFAADASACMAACNSTATCVAFVAVPRPPSGVSCTLKSVAGPGLPPHPPLSPSQPHAVASGSSGPGDTYDGPSPLTTKPLLCIKYVI
jgi:hypothetical protein